LKNESRSDSAKNDKNKAESAAQRFVFTETDRGAKQQRKGRVIRCKSGISAGCNRKRSGLDP